MEFVETPAERFAGLSDWPYEPRFREVDAAGLRMHHVEAGPSEAPPVLMLHGEPSWSYLYRSMIPVCAAAGHRVLAPDLVGFGRSSKPMDAADYTYQRHCEWVRAWIEALDLREITLVCQDWGSLIGLRLAAELEPRFARVVVGNGGLPAGAPPGRGLRGLGNAAAFLAWRSFARWSPWFEASRILQLGTARRLDAATLRAYDAPFPDDRHKAGARSFPLLVPISSRDPAVPANRRAWAVLERWEKPFLTAFSDGDPITRGLDRVLRERIPGARG
jgi:haloalkane dehalogenase